MVTGTAKQFKTPKGGEPMEQNEDEKLEIFINKNYQVNKHLILNKRKYRILLILIPILQLPHESYRQWMPVI